MADSTFNAQLVLSFDDKITGKLKGVETKSLSTAKNMKKGFTEAQSEIGKGFDRLKDMALGFVSFQALTSGLKKGLQEAMDFEKGMAQLASITDKSTKEITEQFGSIIEQTQKTFGKDQKEVIESLFTGFTSGVDMSKEKASEFLDAVGKLSQTGAADMNTASELLTMAMNNFDNMSVPDLAEYINFMRVGGMSTKQMTQVLPELSSVFATAGLTIDELSASMVLLSDKMKVKKATSGLKSFLDTLISPSEKVAETFKVLGLNINSTTIKQKGLGKIAKEIFESTTKNIKSEDKRVQVIKELFGNLDTYQVIQHLGNKSLKEYNALLYDAEHGTTSLNESFEKSQTSSLKWDQAMQNLNIALKTIGTYLAEKLAPIIEMFSDSMMELTRMLKGGTVWNDTKLALGTIAGTMAGKDLETAAVTSGGKNAVDLASRTIKGMNTIGSVTSPLGMARFAGEAVYNFANTYIFNGDANKDDVKKAGQENNMNLEKQIKEIENKKKRQSIGNK